MSRTVAKPPAIFTLLFVGAFLLAITAGVNAFSNGVLREEAADQDVDLSIQGCSCHNPQLSEDVLVDLRAPSRFTAGEEYTIRVSFSGGPEPAGIGQNNGGFNLLVTGGELAAPADMADALKFNADHNEATHTRAGEQNTIRDFNLTWTAPDEATPVMFVVTVNSVNGNGAPDPADLWNQVAYVSQPAEPEFAVENALGGGAEGQEINKIGVHYLAHWVGVVSFAVLFVMYGLTFFLFRFNESRHATDHKDRAK